MSRPYIFHIDFDSYFVSAIRTLKPNLLNKPVAIANKGIHSVAVSVSYELRQLGIKAGAKISEILKKEPKAIIEQPRFDLYIATSNAIFRYIKKFYADKFEIGSIDECYIQVHSSIDSDEKALQLAKRLQDDIENNFKIPISIGISKTKFYAKMTTNLFKPKGIAVTNSKNYQERFFSLPITKFHGIGEKLGDHFKNLEINTIGDLATLTYNDIRLTSIFKTSGFKFIDALNYFADSDVSDEIPEVKGISHDITFNKKDINTEDILQNIAIQAQKVSRRLQKLYKLGNQISFGVRTFSDGWIAKHMVVEKFINEADEIIKYCKQLFYDNFLDTKIIGISIRVSNLINSFENYRSLSILETPKACKSNYIVDQIINKVNTKMKMKSLKTLADYNIERIKKRRGQSDSIEVGVFKR
ncbi:Y-family DNA polymerase [Mycoplasma sp. 4013]